jgi:hypothetical protein
MSKRKRKIHYAELRVEGLRVERRRRGCCCAEDGHTQL